MIFVHCIVGTCGWVDIENSSIILYWVKVSSGNRLYLKNFAFFLRILKLLFHFQNMTWCLPMRLTTVATTCPTKSHTLRGGKGHWPSLEWTLFTCGWKAPGTTSTWSWRRPAIWWLLDSLYRHWERAALSQCRLSHLRISVFIKAPYDPTKIPQWLFQPAKVWWVQLLLPTMRWRRQWCVKEERWPISLKIFELDLLLLQWRLLWSEKLEKIAK